MATIACETRGSVRTLTLARPEKRNALTRALIGDLRRHLDAAAADRSLGVVVIRAEGPTFCSGHDLVEMLSLDHAGLEDLFDECTTTMATIRRQPQIVVAAVRGPAVAGGCHLAVACDLTVCSDQATFSVPGARLGLSGVTAAGELARVIGRRRTLEMVVSGRVVDAGTAHEWGLATHRLPDEHFEEGLAEIVGPIAAARPAVLARIKLDLSENLGLGPDAARRHAATAMARSAAAPEAREGIAAFLERREPVWP